jgi:hypothetical protein
MPEVRTTKREILKRQRNVEKVLDELEDLGIIDLDEEIIQQPSTISPKEVLDIIRTCNIGYNFNEVETAAKMIKGKGITCKQLKVIINSLQCENIHAAPLMTEVMFDIVDPDNIEWLVGNVLDVYSEPTPKEFMELVGVCRPNEFKPSVTASVVDNIPEKISKKITTYQKSLYLLIGIIASSVTIMILILSMMFIL